MSNKDNRRQVLGTHQGRVVCDEVYLANRLFDGNNVIASYAQGRVILCSGSVWERSE